MERRSFLKTAGAGVTAAALAAPAAYAQPSLRWRMATSFPKSLDTLHGNAEFFARQIGEMSNGKFQVSVHAPGEVMPAFGVADGVQNRTVEMAFTASYYFFGKDPTFAIDTAIPFGLNSRQMSAWMYYGNGLNLLREFFANYNIVNFPMGNTGAQMAGWYRKEINSVADMKGLKMRIAGLAGVVMERMGVLPQNIPGGEVYQALEKGVIDATEFTVPYDDEKLGLNKVAPHYYYPGWWEGGAQVSLYVNREAWNSLPADYKSMIDTAAGKAHILLQSHYDSLNPEALKKLVASGTKLQRFPKDVLDAAFKHAMDLYQELSAKNPAWKKVYDDYSRFRRDQNLWFRIAEGSFDQYMHSQRL